jgi:outer membrane protein assembly factor BamD
MSARLFNRFFSCVAALVIAGVLAACSSVERDPTAKWDADRLYAEAKELMQSGNWSQARSMLEKLEARYPFGRHAQQAQMEIAYTYYKEGESAQAVTAADRFLKLNPNHPNADYVQYLKGLASFNDDLGLFGRFLEIDPSRLDPKSMREAFDVFRELTTRWPDSKYAPDATMRMNYLINAMAQSEVNIARFYFQRGAYVAAIQRAQGAVRDFQRSPAAEEALTIIVRSYQGLGLPDMAADAERVLQQNYPNNAFLAAQRRK